MVSFAKQHKLALSWGVAGAAVVLGVCAYVFWDRAAVVDGQAQPASEEVETRNFAPGDAGEMVILPLSPLGEEPGMEKFFGAATTDERREELWRTAVQGTNAEKLRLALEILEAPPSAWTERARQLLILYLGEDAGDDPLVWRRNVEARQEQLARQREKVLENLEQHRAQFKPAN